VDGHEGNQAGRRRVFVVNGLDGRGPSRRQTAPPGVLRPHEQPSRFFAASRSRRSKNSAEQQVAEPTNLAIIPAICLGQLTGTHRSRTLHVFTRHSEGYEVLSRTLAFVASNSGRLDQSPAAECCRVPARGKPDPQREARQKTHPARR